MRLGGAASTNALDLKSATSALRLPSGPTSARPSPSGDAGKGLLRYNETTGRNEQTVEGAWGEIPVTTEIEGFAALTEKDKDDVTNNFLEFSGIPSGTNVVIILLDGIVMENRYEKRFRSSGAAVYAGAQLGDAGGYETTGYVNQFTPSSAHDINSTSLADGIFLARAHATDFGGSGGVIVGGAATLGLFLWHKGNNVWELEKGGLSANQRPVQALPTPSPVMLFQPWNRGATKQLSGELDRVRIGFKRTGISALPVETQQSFGRETFTGAGQANIMYA